MQSLTRYKILNWADYNKALIQRGSITFWFDEESLKKWFSSNHTCVAGRPQTYSDEAILMILVIREFYKLPLRALEGFIRSIFLAMNVSLPVPSYTQISKRAKRLHKHIERLLKGKKGKHLIFDSTGLKVYGEGEWKVKVHGKSKRRTWRKLHIGIDAYTQNIVCSELTENNAGDGQVSERMLKKIPGKIESAWGDGAYDGSRFRKIVHEKGGRCIVPPPKDAAYKFEATESWEKERNDSIAVIHGIGHCDLGRKLWKIFSKYHLRSRVENTMYRIKQITGCGLKARSFDSQKTEALCKCLVINKLNKLGMPKFEWVLKVA